MNKIVYNGQTVIDFEELLKNILTTENTTEYTPSAEYHPATKKYVDDLISDISAGGGIPMLTGTSTDPIKLYELEDGAYIIKGYHRQNDSQYAIDSNINHPVLYVKSGSTNMGIGLDPTNPGYLHAYYFGSVGVEQSSILWDTPLKKPVDKLTSTDKTSPLSANQGKVLNDKITNIEGQLGNGIKTITLQDMTDICTEYGYAESIVGFRPGLIYLKHGCGIYSIDFDGNIYNNMYGANGYVVAGDMCIIFDEGRWCIIFSSHTSSALTLLYTSGTDDITSSTSYTIQKITSNSKSKWNENFANLNNMFAKNNTTSFTPTSDYHPATKKYVDDNLTSSTNKVYVQADEPTGAKVGDIWITP